MPAKTKARDIIQGWPRGRSTSAFTGARYFASLLETYGYRVMFLPWERQENRPTTSPFTDWRQEFIVTPDFRRTTEIALEYQYHARQQEMVDEDRKRTGFAGIVVNYPIEFSGDSLCECGHWEKFHSHELSLPCRMSGVEKSYFTSTTIAYKPCNCPIFRPTNDIDKFRLAVARAAEYGR